MTIILIKTKHGNLINTQLTLAKIITYSTTIITVWNKFVYVVSSL